jgi:dienelactone hydrolase
VVNGRNALEYVLKQLPQVNPKRVYTAGHSSAATVSLLLAEHEPRLAGCIAYAAPTDVAAELEEFGAFDDPAFTALLPGVEEFARRSSPVNHAAHISMPVFLFHATDDDVQSYRSSEQMAARLRQAGKSVTLRMVDRFGHHESMTREGIPAAIEWLMHQPQELGEARSPAPPQDLEVPAKTPSTAAPTPGTTPPPTFPRPGRDVGPMPPPGTPVVVFDMTGFDGNGSSYLAARRALTSVGWAHRVFVRIEETQGRIVIGVQGGSVNTAEAKTALEREGFQIGGVQYRPGGL